MDVYIQVNFLQEVGRKFGGSAIRVISGKHKLEADIWE
jgi:hypothetical protein